MANTVCRQWNGVVAVALDNMWNLYDHCSPIRNVSLAGTVYHRHHHQFRCNLYTAMADTHCDRVHNNHSPDERVMFHRVDQDLSKCPFRPMKRRLVHKCLDLGPMGPNDNWNLRTENVSRESIPFDNLPRVHKLMFVVPIAMPHVCRPMHVGNKLRKWKWKEKKKIISIGREIVQKWPMKWK